MNKPAFWTPRLPEPLPAVLAGAGFFFFLAVLAHLGPVDTVDRWLRRADESAPAPLAVSAVRVLGTPLALSPAAKADVLAADVAWLRAQGAGAIVLEAWLDDAPQADARAFAQLLEARMEALPKGRARTQALALVSATAAGLDAPVRLAHALKEAQPLLLAYQAIPGGGAPLPDALRRQAYEVSLRGELQTLPAYQPLHLPYSEALDAVGRAGAVPLDPLDASGIPAAVCVDGRWVNGLGLEAARLALGLPLDGLHYRWRKGALSAVEMLGVRYELDAAGRLRVPASVAALPQVNMASLRSDPVAAARMKGKVVFFRPWPTQLGQAQSFEEQARLFTAVVERDVAQAPAATEGPAEWVPILAWAAAVMVMAYAPLWLTSLFWGGWAFLGVQALQSPAGRQGLAPALGLAVSALLLGLGWRLQRRRGQSLAAASMLQGRVAAAQQLAWRRILRRGHASVTAGYAVLGPRSKVGGPAWELWLEQSGALLDEVQEDAVGVIFAEPSAKAALCTAVLDLRHDFPELRAGLSYGTLSFRMKQQLGATAWEIQGPPKDVALGLFQKAEPSQIVLSKKDASEFKYFVHYEELGNANGLREASAGTLVRGPGPGKRVVTVATNLALIR